MRLLIGIPTGGSPAAPFIESLQKLELPPQTTAAGHLLATGNYVPAQRELIVERALTLQTDVLVMCDDDMILPSDALIRLTEVLEQNSRCALVGALYYSRDGFRPMVVDQWNPDDTTSALIPAFDDHTPVSVSGVGFGCIAIRMAAVRTFKPPYFSAHIYIEKQAARVRVCDEDYLFCSRLRYAGWDVFLHPGVRCGHYDRATGIAHPRHWESTQETDHPRMAVMRDGMAMLIPAELGGTHSRETHSDVHLTYIEVD